MTLDWAVVLLIFCHIWWFEVWTGDARSKLCWLIPVSWLVTTIRIRLLWIMLMDQYKSLHYKQHHHPPHQHHHLEQWLTHHVTSIRCINHRNRSLENNPGNLSSQHLVTTTHAVILIQSQYQSSYRVTSPWQSSIWKFHYLKTLSSAFFAGNCGNSWFLFLAPQI